MLNRICGLLLLAMLASSISACGGGSGQPAISGELRGGASSSEIVTFSDPGVPGVDYTTQFITVGYVKDAQLPAHLRPAGSGPGGPTGGYAEITQSIAQRFGVVIAQEIYWDKLNMAAFEVPAGASGSQILSTIRADYGSVLSSAHFSRLLKRTAAVDDPFYKDSNANNESPGNWPNNQWGQRRIGLHTSYDSPGESGAWDFTFGDPSVRIAVCDTGVFLTHDTLNETVMKPNVDFPSLKLNVAPHPPSGHNNDVTDTQGHGTYIAGIVAAKRDNQTIVGVAPSCKVVPVKISDGEFAFDFDMYAGAWTAVTQAGCKVVNLSWGGSSNTQTLQDCVDDIAEEGALLVVAAGNEGDKGNPPQFPAASQNAFAVASTNSNDARSGFSNYGSFLDVAAPGQNLIGPWVGPSNAYTLSSGTSFAAPIVAAVAGLMWSVKPELTNTEIRQILIETGRPTTGFNSTVPRIDAAAALKVAAGLQLGAPALPQLLASGTVTLTPEVSGVPDRIDSYFNGVLIDSKTTGPWDFQFDTSSVQFGVASIEFRGYDGAEMRSASVQLAIDNTAGSYPLVEGFESPAATNFLGYDARSLNQASLNSLYNVPGGDQDVDMFGTDGAASWQYVGSGGFDGSLGSQGCFSGSSYGAYEVDALVSRKLTIPAASADPTLVFYHKYNLEKGGAGGPDYDRGWILVTEDGGATFSAAKLKNGSPAYFSGYQSGWWKADIDLSDFGGKTVNLLFCLQSDGAQAGEQPGAAGWWIDQVTIATDYNETIPQIGGVNVSEYSIYGEVPGQAELSIEVVQPTNVNRVSYIVDVLPYGPFDPAKDLKIDVAGAAPWAVEVNIPNALNNQLAHLRVQYFDSASVAGPELVVPVWIFNQPGDVNADGAVNQADLNAFPAALGLKQGDSGFVPFFDTDLDGVVRENDAAAIGYNWGS